MGTIEEGAVDESAFAGLVVPAAAAVGRIPRDSAFRPLTLEMLRSEGGKIAEIVDFSTPALFTAFGLPATL